MNWRNDQTAVAWANMTLTRGVYEDWRNNAKGLLEQRRENSREPRTILAERLRERNAEVEGALLVDWSAIADQLLMDAR